MLLLGKKETREVKIEGNETYNLFEVGDMGTVCMG